MLDFSFGELAVIGAVALVVLGPERLPKVARTVGDWVGKAQRYVNQVKTDINREMELSELKKLQEEARNAAQTFQSSVEGAVGAVEADLNKIAG
jgi:sec-independent protein translocase protein TatB